MSPVRGDEPAIDASDRTMRVLVMGGTQFNGLALVHELARCGHDVTIVNRGQTEAPLPGGIHRLYADRTDHDQMRQVLGNEALGGREFDVVLDMSAYHPDDVNLMMEIFEGRTGQYVFASSTVVYATADMLPIDEDHPVQRDHPQIEYGGNKLLCEDALMAAHAERGFPATVVYFSMVYGPRNIIPDREQRMYARLEAGRPVMVPGDGTTVSQVGHVDDQARALEAVMHAPATTQGGWATAVLYFGCLQMACQGPAVALFVATMGIGGCAECALSLCHTKKSHDLRSR